MKKYSILLIALTTTLVCFAYPKMYNQVVGLTQGTVQVIENADHSFVMTPVPENGYTFLKWKDNNSREWSRTVCCVERTYTAVFAAGYTVTLNCNYQTDSIIGVPTGCSIDALPSRTKAGATFIGWSPVEGDASQVISIPYTPTKDITLYAVFKIEQMTVTTKTTTEFLGLTQSDAEYIDLTIANGAVLTVTESTAESQYHFKSITIGAGGKLVVPAGKFIKADHMYMQGGEADANDVYQFIYPQLVNNGSLTITDNIINYDYLLNKKQQYTLCLPVSVALSSVLYADGTAAEYGKDYKVATYSGAARATGATGWSYLTGTETLEAGKGYTVFATPRYRPYAGGGSMVQETYSRLRFPMNVASAFAETDKDVAVQTADATKPNDAGWNLVGNPYFATYHNVGGLTGSNNIHLLSFNGDGYDWTGDQRYVVIPADNGKGYSSELASTATLPAFKNFFVQIGTGDALQFAVSNRAQNAPARYMTQPVEIMTGLVLSNNSSSDKMGVLLGDDYTSAYEINADLQKFGHNTGVNVYAYMDKSELAFVAVNEQYAANAIPVGYIAPAAGTYVFALDVDYPGEQVEHVWLYDSQTRTTTDLKTSTYEFTTTSGINNTRFTISVNVAQQTPTDIRTISSDENNVIYDVLGRPMKASALRQGQFYIMNKEKYIK